ncbi:MAG: glycosyltransferase [Woeseiaceae bacterium]|nr:glycosyltransferase [Woeseiaceae bacterium]
MIRRNDVRVGHVNLAKPGSRNSSRFVGIVEALNCEGLEQHLVLRDRSIARQLMPLGGVSIGPVAHTAVTASCLVPSVDVAHVHDPAAGQAGLILTLTRSIPYVLTHRGELPNGRHPLVHAVYRRAAYVICPDHADVDLLHHFEPGLRVAVIQETREPAAIHHLVRVYQNSQRIPMAGNNGIQ